MKNRPATIKDIARKLGISLCFSYQWYQEIASKAGYNVMVCYFREQAPSGIDQSTNLP